MNEDFNKKIILKIKKSDIKPKSKTFYFFKNLTPWLTLVVFVLIGSLAFASVFYRLSGDYEILTHSFSRFGVFSDEFLFFVPFTWIIFAIAFLYFAFFNYKKTELFYRNNLSVVFALLVSVSLLVGAVLFALGVSEKTEEIGVKYLPFYDRYLALREVRKNIFLKKVESIGITADILDGNPKLKEKVDRKFRENVLGKRYIGDLKACEVIKFVCKSDEIRFSDEYGCGCRDVYSSIK